MSRLNASFVLGYHGCSKVIADEVVCGTQSLKPSGNDWDWLGSGTYFWESDPERALEWARDHGEGEPAVVGAVIDLGNCLNLMSREGISNLRDAHESYVQMRRDSGKPIAINKDPKGTTPGDQVLRMLDNAVIEHLHAIIKEGGTLEPFDTVRAMFPEGKEVYPGAGFRDKSHIQIAVRTPDCIKGYFWPRPFA